MNIHCDNIIWDANFIRIFQISASSTKKFSLVDWFWYVAWQVSLWDAIIPAKEFAKFSIHTSNKYRFIDQVCHPVELLFYILSNSGIFLYARKINF